LIRYFVLFVIDLKTRRVEIAGILPRPDGEWMKQIARNFADCEEGFPNGFDPLIHDRDPLFTTSFHAILRSSGVETVKLPARRPTLNAYAERFVRSIKSECLSRIIPLGEEHLRHAVKEYTEHYHLERNHQGLDNRLIEGRSGAVDMNPKIKRHERLGGALNYYERRVA
jgi:transposase InsO family protein